MSYLAYTCFIILSTVDFNLSLKLPSYITACHKNDPNLNDCVVRNGNAAIPKFINGDPKYRVPKFDPLEITELVISQGTPQFGLSLALRDIKIYGLKDIKLIKARTDLINRHIEWDFLLDNMQFISSYKATGKILVLPITGEGPANVTVTGMKITYKYDYDLIKKPNGKEYMNFTKSDLIFEQKRAYFQLKNLFNGDKTLGDNMLLFLNENSKDVMKEIGPGIAQAIAEVFKQLLISIAELVPYEDIYVK